MNTVKPAVEVAPPKRRGFAPTKHIDILWAAVKLFGKQGVAQTSTREIAAMAKTTERTLFQHYKSKDGLVQAVIAQAVLPHLAPTSLDGLRALIAAHSGDLRSWHATLLRQRSLAMAESPELARLLLIELLRDAELRHRFGRQWLEAAWEPLTSLFKTLQLEGKMSAQVAPETLTRLFMSLNLGYLAGRHLLAPEQVWDDDAEIDAITLMFSHGAGVI